MLQNISMKEYYQIKRNGDDMDPLLRRWKIIEGRLMPKTMDLMHAPPDIPITIRCNCKSGCVNLRCSCKINRFNCWTVILHFPPKIPNFWPSLHHFWPSLHHFWLDWDSDSFPFLSQVIIVCLKSCNSVLLWLF